jgi:hypothetical protein
MNEDEDMLSCYGISVQIYCGTHMVTRLESRPDSLYKEEVYYMYFLFLFCFVCLVANWSSSFTAQITKYISQTDGCVFEWVGEVCSGGSNEEALMKWK